MSAILTSWRVTYGDDSDAVNESFKSLDFFQSGSSTLSVAHHVFEVTNTFDGERLADIVLNHFQEKEVKFTIVDVDESQQQEFHHEVFNYELSSSRSGGYIFRLVTVDAKMRLAYEFKNRSMRGDSLTDIAKQVIEEAGLTVDKIEDAEPISEFGVMRQINLSDYEFIVSRIIPRLPKGYSLVSLKGKGIGIYSTGYEAEKYTPDPFMIKRVVESDRVSEIIQKGGVHHYSGGYDPFMKRPISALSGPSAEPAYGEQELEALHSCFSLTPFFSQLALNSWAESFQRKEAYKAYPLQVVMFGHIPEQTGWDFPMVFEAPELEYRKNYEYSGWVEAFRHVIRYSNYTVTALLQRAANNI